MGWFSRKKTKKVQENGLTQRSFEAAVRSRLHTPKLLGESIDSDVKNSLSEMRKISRDLEQNNDYIKRYLNLLKTNVIGPTGIRLQCLFKDAKGELKTFENEMIETAFTRWSGRKCEVTGRYTWPEVQRLVLGSVARDGEAIIRLVNSNHNAFKFSLQLIDIVALDETLNDPEGAHTGHRIRMGIEIDEWGARTAYFLRSESVGPNTFFLNGQKYLRIPAQDIIHVYRADYGSQTRGYPWSHTAINRLRMLQGYEEAELVAARVASSKMGFFKRTSIDGKYEGDDLDQDEKGNYITEASPGSFEILPEGVEFHAWSPEHPSGNYQHFVKATLRGVAAGLGVSYNSLAVDLEGVNYSSLRAGLLEERDFYKTTQEWFIDAFIRPVYERWLDSAYLAGQIILTAKDLDRYRNPTFLPRRWAWVDPLKDVNAAIASINAGLKSRAEVASEQGRSIEDIFSELAREEAMIDSKGITITGMTATTDDGDGEREAKEAA